MLEEKTPSLPGNVYDGLEGVLWMSETPEKRGEPALEAIGHALGRLAESLDCHPARRSRFHDILDKTKAAYPGCSAWDTEFGLMADRNRWPRWSVEWCLALYVEDESDAAGGSAFVWDWVLAFLSPSYPYDALSSLCEGHVVRTQLSPEARQLAKLIADTIQAAREQIPMRVSSFRAMIGSAFHAVSALRVDDDAPLSEKARSAIKMAHEQAFHAFIGGPGPGRGVTERRSLDGIGEPIELVRRVTNRLKAS